MRIVTALLFELCCDELSGICTKWGLVVGKKPGKFRRKTMFDWRPPPAILNLSFNQYWLLQKPFVSELKKASVVGLLSGIHSPPRVDTFLSKTSFSPKKHWEINQNRRRRRRRPRQLTERRRTAIKCHFTVTFKALWVVNVGTRTGRLIHPFVILYRLGWDGMRRICGAKMAQTLAERNKQVYGARCATPLLLLLLLLQADALCEVSFFFVLLRCGRNEEKTFVFCVCVYLFCEWRLSHGLLLLMSHGGRSFFWCCWT